MTRSTGTQTRSWSYTGNFLMSSTNPENGTTSYAYGSNNKVSQRTDAKGQVTTYTYDGYARLSEVQRYPSGLSGGADPCQQENYYYDGYNPLSSSYPHYALGRLSAVQYWGGYNPLTSPTCDTVFTEMYNYGVPGAPVGKQLTVNRSGAAFSLAATYTYDTEGRMSAETYPTDNSGTTASLSYTFDSMGRLNTMTDALAMQTIIAGASYGPANELTGITGATGGWAGESRTYNSLKQLTGISAGAVSVTYAYPSTQNNGKITSETDGGYSGEVITYTYDSLNRLITASDQPTWPFSWGQSYSYDGFGNLTNVSVTQGSAPSFSQSYDVNNHAGGEDANGNPGNVPLPAYGTSEPATYDVENRLVAIVGTWSSPTAYYSYDPSNKRVWRGDWAYSGSWARTEDEITFWSVTGQKLATYNVTQYGATLYATQSGTNYYFGAKLIKNASGWVYSNRLGSIGTFFPYGQERPSATGNNTEKFTGYYRDAETGNDYAINRYMSPGFGRFFTPDPSQGSFANPANPGSWNLYAYAKGDPIGRRDPLGLDDDDCYYGSEFDCGNDSDGDTDVDPFNGAGCNGTACGDVTNPTANQPSPTNQSSTAQCNLTVSDNGVLQCTVTAQVLSNNSLNLDTGPQLASQPISPSGDGSSTPNSLPWYRNSCVTGALGDGLLHVGIDSIGLIPEGGLVSRAVGNYAFSYRGIVATQQGTKAIQATKLGTALTSTGVFSNDTSTAGVASTALGVAGIAVTVARATPGVGQIISGISIAVDLYNTGKEIAKCY